MLVISNSVKIPEEEIQMTAIRAQGAGGQNVNKVASAIHLRFDISESSLPERHKEKLLNLRDHRITKLGVIVIKAQEHRTQEANKEVALKRLQTLIKDAVKIQKPRKASKPTKSSKRKRLDRKSKRGQVKVLRKKVSQDDY